MTTRSALNQAAVTLASHHGLTLQNKDALDLWEGPKVKGYFRLAWFLIDKDGQDWGSIVLRCGGGYGAGLGKSYYQGHVTMARKDGTLDGYVGHTLVGSWDYPFDGAESAKATRREFVRWAKNYKAT